MTDTANMNFRVDKSLRDAFKQKAMRNGTNATTLLTQWMQDYCNDNNDGNDEEQDSHHRSNDGNNSNGKIGELEERLNQLTAQVDALQDSNDSNDTVTTTELEARLEPLWETLQGLSCPLSIRDNDSNDNAMTEEAPTKSPLQSEDKGSETPQQENSEESQEQENSEKAQLPEPLSQSALAKRLGCKGNSILYQRKKGSGHLKQWSRERDPDGIAWDYDSRDKKYHPVKETKIKGYIKRGES